MGLKNSQAGKTVKNTKLASTGGSIAKNNTSFNKGAVSAKATKGFTVKSKGETLTNPKFDKLENTGRAAAKKPVNSLPARMTQKGSQTLPTGKNSYGQPSKQVNTARGAADSTVGNLKSYLKRKANGEVR